MPEGTLASLHRWPVKSLSGETLGELDLGRDGVHGDRAHAVVAAGDGAAPLSARQVPRLLAWSAAYAEGLAEGPRVTAPDGRRFAWHDRELAPALSQDLGRPVSTNAHPGANHDRPGTVLVTTEATRGALEAQLGSPVDVRRFRTNLHLELDAPAYGEEGLAGSLLRLGSGVLVRLRSPCVRCTVPTRDPDRPERRQPEVLRWLQLNRAGVFGVIGAVEARGRVARGDPVTIDPA